MNDPNFESWIQRPHYLAQVYTTHRIRQLLPSTDLFYFRVLPSFRSNSILIRRKQLARLLKEERKSGLINRAIVRQKALAIIKSNAPGIAARVDFEEILRFCTH